MKNNQLEQSLNQVDYFQEEEEYSELGTMLPDVTRIKLETCTVTLPGQVIIGFYLVLIAVQQVWGTVSDPYWVFIQRPTCSDLF